jgi:hypothetical protein
MSWRSILTGTLTPLRPESLLRELLRFITIAFVLNRCQEVSWVLKGSEAPPDSQGEFAEEQERLFAG